MAELKEARNKGKKRVDCYFTYFPHCMAQEHHRCGMKKTLAAGSHLISLSYLAFPLVKLSISEAFGGSRLSLSFGENELSWKLHYLPCLM